MSDIQTATYEREQQAGDLYQAPIIDRRFNAVTPGRVLSRFDKLERAGRISIQARDAGCRFERRWEMHDRATVTAGYGTRHAEGTPVSQLSGDDREFRKVDWYGAYKDDVAAIGPKHALVLLDAIKGLTVEQIGRKALGPSRKGVALHAGLARVRSALDALTRHYWPSR